MTWTTHKPTVPGWYWFKSPWSFEIVYLDESNRVHRNDVGDGPIEKYTGHWAGPLTPPEENARHDRSLTEFIGKAPDIAGPLEPPEEGKECGF